MAAAKHKQIKLPSLVSQKDRRATSRSPSTPDLIAKHCCVQETKGAFACTTSSSITSPILLESKMDQHKYGRVTLI